MPDEAVEAEQQSLQAALPQAGWFRSIIGSSGIDLRLGIFGSLSIQSDKLAHRQAGALIDIDQRTIFCLEFLSHRGCQVCVSADVVCVAGLQFMFLAFAEFVIVAFGAYIAHLAFALS